MIPASLRAQFDAARRIHKQLRFPHEGGCPVCRDLRMCNHCGRFLDAPASHCTNGRCADCHVGACSSGGATEPGHGYWRDGVDKSKATA